MTQGLSSCRIVIYFFIRITYKDLCTLYKKLCSLKLYDYTYRITPHTSRTFTQCSTYVKEGVRVINWYIDQNFFTSMPRVRGRVGQGWKHHLSTPRRKGRHSHQYLDFNYVIIRGGKGLGRVN